MRINRFRLVAAAPVVALLAGLAHSAPPTQAATADLDCSKSLIEKPLKNGAVWRMCAYVHPIKGLVLEKIEFKPASGTLEYSGYKRILDQVYLAQLNVPYDNGTAYYNDIPSYGFGNQYLMPQGADLCLGEPLNVRQSYTYLGSLIERIIPGICANEVPTGLTTHSGSINSNRSSLVGQGTALEVSSMSKISWYEYQQKVTFDDHGQIDIALGATGDLAPGTPGSPFFDTNPRAGWPVGPPIDAQDYYAASHWHNAIYRVDFGIDEGARQDVEQWDYTGEDRPQGPIVNASRTHKDSAFSSVPGRDHNEVTWWRVLNPGSPNRDGHPRSYEIVNQGMTDKFLGVTSPIVSFTNANSCQEYASDNLNPGCPDQGVLDYVAQDDAPLTDPIAWVNVGFHHIARDEDQSPMPVHWQRFQLAPRDFFAQSPAITDERVCINGPPVGLPNNMDSCIATNTARPRISSDTPGIRPGTRLSATPGTWAAVGTPWNYAYLWFRNGEPINDPGSDPAINSQYVVREADRGMALTVKVTASQTGYGTGTAESLPISVPGLPTTPTPTATSATSTVTPRPSPVASRTKALLTRTRITTRQNTRVKVTVTARGLTPTGRFEVRHGTKVLRMGTLRHGRATLTVPKFKKPRLYRLRIVYLGNKTTKPSYSSFLSLRVRKK